jgi:glycosyltransferase involved in cell wall biosynthesis
MKLSVRIITYNHAPFIAQAIESVLRQRTNFDFDIVIGEDASPDGTRVIVADYAKRYPGKIKALFHDRKNVIYFRGKPTSRYNFVETLKHCTGEYVALLDGDDFWTSPDKLQQQVDYLDAHKEFAICSHDVVKLYGDGSEKPGTTPTTSYGFEELLALKNYPPTCSVVYRNQLIKEFPEWFYRVMVSDFPLHLLNAQHGRIAHLPKTLATYRQHGGGMWAGQGSPKATVTWNEGMVDLYRTLDTAFEGRYHTIIKKKIAAFSYDTAWACWRLQDWQGLRKYVAQGIKAGPFNAEAPARTMKLWTVATCPPAYRAYAAIKKMVRGKSGESTTELRQVS